MNIGQEGGMMVGEMGLMAKWRKKVGLGEKMTLWVLSDGMKIDDVGHGDM